MPGEKHQSTASLLGQPALMQILERSAADKTDKAWLRNKTKYFRLRLLRILEDL